MYMVKNFQNMVWGYVDVDGCFWAYITVIAKPELKKLFLWIPLLNRIF